jgi:hypothetical protein
MFRLANTVYTLKYIYGAVIYKVVVTLLLLLLWIDWNRLALKLVPSYCLRPHKLLTVLNVRCISVCFRLLPSRKAVWGFDFRSETGWSVHVFVCINVLHSFILNISVLHARPTKMARLPMNCNYDFGVFGGNVVALRG